MRDDKARAPLHQFVHRLLNVHFRPRIDTARRFIQYEDRGSASIARAIVNSCFCPWEIFDASSFSTVS